MNEPLPREDKHFSTFSLFDIGSIICIREHQDFNQSGDFAVEVIYRDKQKLFFLATEAEEIARWRKEL